MTEMTINIKMNNDSLVPVIKRFINSIKGITSTFSISRANNDKTNSMEIPRNRTIEFRDKFFGKLDDPRTADEIIEDIYASRRNKDESELLKAFE